MKVSWGMQLAQAYSNSKIPKQMLLDATLDYGV